MLLITAGSTVTDPPDEKKKLRAYSVRRTSSIDKYCSLGSHGRRANIPQYY